MIGIHLKNYYYEKYHVPKISTIFLGKTKWFQKRFTEMIPESFVSQRTLEY